MKQGISDDISSHSLQNEAIAIVGMSCRFPGANNIQEFWQLLCEGRDAIQEIPSSRFPLDHYYDERPGIAGKVISRYGGILDQIDTFDAPFFQIPPEEATRMDPQHRLLLEVAWEALEDAGLTRSHMSQTDTGIFIGMWANDYEDLQFQHEESISAYTVLNSVRSVSSGRLSYFLNLRGPSMTIDAACSSSLVAVHLACQSIRSGESTLALVGGANLILEPAVGIGFSQAGMLAPDGRCKFGDAQADGYVRGDGVGLVVLKPLSSALADDDPIYAVIRGSAVNNDANDPDERRRLAKPSRTGHKDLLRKAYKSAGIAPTMVSYVEAHGTGTRAGDPVELEALSAILGEGRSEDMPCYTGSVKTNIGHTEGAAGIASLIKTALCLKHRTIVPTLHYHEPNPAISWQHQPFIFPSTTHSWPITTQPIYAGVSAFGVSGTNAHVVLEEAPSFAPIEEKADSDKAQAYLLPLSARCSEALAELAVRYVTFLNEETREELASICYTASVHRTHHEQRLALVGRTKKELVEQLQGYLATQDKTFQPVYPSLQRKIVFVFPGQGSQWIGMGRGLYQQQPLFRDVLHQCARAIQCYADWSLLDVLMTDEGTTLLERIDVIQPTLFALEVALASLWRSWGVEPDAVIGHSMGEIAAAYVAGALGLSDATRIICRRSQLMRRLGRQGAMLFVELSFTEAQQLLVDYDKKAVSLAASNGPRSTILSGDRSILEMIAATLRLHQIFCRFVKVDVASHSPYMDTILDDLRTALIDLQPQRPQIPIRSTVSVGGDSDDPCFDTAYWMRNVREPVLFAQGVQRLLEQGHTIFVEVSPHPVLQSSLRQCIEEAGREAIVQGTLQRDEDEHTTLLQALGMFYTLGVPINWTHFYPEHKRRVPLPMYPWQRQRFWFPLHKTGVTQQNPEHQTIGTSVHYPFLQHSWQSALHTSTRFISVCVDCDSLPYIKGHRIRNIIVLPATVYLEMALEAANATLGSGSYGVENVEFIQALTLPESGNVNGQIILSLEDPEHSSFQFFSATSPINTTQDTWSEHAQGTIYRIQQNRRPPQELLVLSDIQMRCSETWTQHDYYEHMRRRQIDYGPGFQGLTRIWKGQNEALAQLGITRSVREDAHSYVLHPAWFDACLQVVFAAIPHRINGSAIARSDTYIPVRLKHLSIRSLPGSHMDHYWSYARIRSGTDNNQIEGDIYLLDAQGNIMIEVNGLALQRGKRELPQEYMYVLRWLAEPHAGKKLIHKAAKHCVLFSGGSKTGRLLTAELKQRGSPYTIVAPGIAYRHLDATMYQVNPTQGKDLMRLLQELSVQIPAGYDILYLWGLEIPEVQEQEALEQSYLALCEQALTLIQALVQMRTTLLPRLWLLTKGASAVTADREPVQCLQAPLWGLRRVLLNEHPEVSCTTVDLSTTPSEQEITALVDDVWSESADLEIALRGEIRYVQRLVQGGWNQEPAVTSIQQSEGSEITRAKNEQFYLQTAAPGISDALQFQAGERRVPGPGEVEIQIYASALNFRDVLSSLGMYPGYPQGVGPLGIECAGKITAVGDGVEAVHIGDAVIALANHAIGAYVTTDAHFVLPRPAHMSFEEAVTIPVAFLTASYALKSLGRLQPGERVLIHSATGGVGLAAVRLAQSIGAEIFATAGTPEKRDFLRSLGIQHVMGSRSLDFAAEVMQLTAGQGVDVVLNSLSGTFIQKGLSILRPCGRFLELGKRDIYQGSQLPLTHFRNNLAYFAIDLDLLLRKYPALVRDLLNDIRRDIQEEIITPLPFQVFPLHAIVEAFRYMTQAKHIGKVVISQQMQKETPAPTIIVPSPRVIREDATYLISGGLGGIGLALAQWLSEQGARYLILLSRHDPSTEARSRIKQMRATGVFVMVVRADVANEGAISCLLEDMRQQMPPLKGVIHAAAVLDDAMLTQLTQEHFKTVMIPKVLGAWNLHRRTCSIPLDFFVCFSSAATIIAPPGQGNYIAANAYLDAFVEYRRALGLPAQSIHWGPWGEVGFLTARPELKKHFADRGLESIDTAIMLELFGHILMQKTAQGIVMSMNWKQWQQFYPAACASSFLRQLVTEQVVSLQPAEECGSLLTDNLHNADPAQQQVWLETYLLGQFAEIRGIPTTKLQVQVPLLQQGLDSLMAVELRNRIQRDLKVGLRVKQLLGKATIRQVAEQVAQLLNTEITSAVPADHTLFQLHKLHVAEHTEKEVISEQC